MIIWVPGLVSSSDAVPKKRFVEPEQTAAAPTVQQYSKLTRVSPSTGHSI